MTFIHRRNPEKRKLPKDNTANLHIGSLYIYIYVYVKSCSERRWECYHYMMKTGKPTSSECFAWTAPPLLGHKALQPAASAAVLRHSQATAPVGTCRCPEAWKGVGPVNACRHPGPSYWVSSDLFWWSILFYILAGVVTSSCTTDSIHAKWIPTSCWKPAFFSTGSSQMMTLTDHRYPLSSGGLLAQSPASNIPLWKGP